MIRVVTIVALALLVTACGVKRPLMRPADVPAYEAERAKERAEREADRQKEMKQ